MHWCSHDVCDVCSFKLIDTYRRVTPGSCFSLETVSLTNRDSLVSVRAQRPPRWLAMTWRCGAAVPRRSGGSRYAGRPRRRTVVMTVVRPARPVAVHTPGSGDRSPVSGPDPDGTPGPTRPARCSAVENLRIYESFARVRRHRFFGCRCTGTPDTGDARGPIHVGPNTCRNPTWRPLHRRKQPGKTTRIGA